MKDDRRTEGTPVRRRRLSLDERERLLQEFRRSGMSQRTFSASKGISVGTLRNWNLWEEKRAQERISFKELEIRTQPAPPITPWDAEVSLPDGLVLRLRESVARDVIRSILGRK